MYWCFNGLIIWSHELGVEYEFCFHYGLGLLCMRWWWVLCCRYVIFMCCMLEVFVLLEELLVELNVVWGFPYLGAQWRLFRLCETVERGPLRLCEAVVEDWLECCTLSPVWSSGEGKDVFFLFRLVASIVPDVRCIDVFTHNSLRDKGDSLAALSRTHRTACSRKLDVVVGWEAAENQRIVYDYYIWRIEMSVMLYLI